MTLIRRRRDPDPPDYEDRIVLAKALYEAILAGKLKHRIWVDDWWIRVEVEPGVRRLISKSEARRLLAGEPLETILAKAAGEKLAEYHEQQKPKLRRVK